jgi:hypothetical protein
MTQRPILFSAEMVQALLDGRKTQTRRKVKLTADGHVQAPSKHLRWYPTDPGALQACRYGQPGDTLWVRETWKPVPISAYRCSEGVQQTPNPQDADEAAVYKAGWDRSSGGVPWRPSIHMPRWASRITLRITDVRVERLQNIEGQHPSESDAIAEGVRAIHHGDGEYYYSAFRDEPHPKNWCDPADAFKELWNKINGPGTWDENPWVWVVAFEKVKP